MPTLRFFIKFVSLADSSNIELMINKVHGLSPSGGLVSPSGGFASLFFDQVGYFASIKLCQALSRQGAIIKIPVVRCHYLLCSSAQLLQVLILFQLRFLKEPSQIQMLIRKPKTKRRKKTEQLSAQVQLGLHLEYLNFVGPTYIKDYYQTSYFLWRPTYKCGDLIRQNQFWTLSTGEVFRKSDLGSQGH